MTVRSRFASVSRAAQRRPGAIVPLCLAALAATSLAACSSDGGSSAPTIGYDNGGDPRGHLIGATAPHGGGSATTAGVNAYLWRAAIDTLSFMPFASADPFGGVIITDWYQPPTTSGERFKATAYILGDQLRADAVRVAIFRQVQQGGAWVDAPASPNTAAEITNKVLARARALRAAS